MTIVKILSIFILTIVLAFSLYHIAKAIIHVVHDEHRIGAKKADFIRSVREHRLNLKNILRGHRM